MIDDVAKREGPSFEQEDYTHIQSQSANIFISWEYKINQNSHYERYAYIKHKTYILKVLIGTIFI